MAVIGNAPALGIITGDNILDGSITAADLAPGAAVPSQTGNSGKYLTTDGTNSASVVVNNAGFTVMAESADASEGTTAGYIDDFRVTKGYAQYTANFTPPIAALKGK